jgi:hypothetical protein
MVCRLPLTAKACQEVVTGSVLEGLVDPPCEVP